MSSPGQRLLPAQQGPPASVARIPTSRPTGTHWYREHGHRPAAPDGGCWYFAPLPPDPAAGGLFDLPAPYGTCYFADQAHVAALERVGRFTAQHQPVPADLVAGRIVTTVDTDMIPSRLVNLLAQRAATHFGVTGELFTLPDYAVPQTWAALHDAGHDGLTYTPRFSPKGRATAVFGPPGPRPDTISSSQPLHEVLTAARIPVATIPASHALTFRTPPTPAT